MRRLSDAPIALSGPRMTTPRLNHVFVDYENVQDVDLQLIREKPVKVVLVVGKQQKNLPLAWTKAAIQIGAAQVEILEAGCAGKNALDLVLAYHLGRKAREDAAAFFHILSKDKAFDALVTHLKAEGVRVLRTEVFSQIPVLVDVKTLPLEDRSQRVRERMGKLKTEGRPKKLKKLQSMIHSLFQKELTEGEVMAVIKKLVREKFITVSKEENIGYS